MGGLCEINRHDCRAETYTIIPITWSIPYPDIRHFNIVDRYHNNIFDLMTRAIRKNLWIIHISIPVGGHILITVLENVYIRYWGMSLS